MDNNEGNIVRILIIGAGSRGNQYAEAITASTNAVVHAVADPIEFKRKELGKRYVWQNTEKSAKGQEFVSWQEFLIYEEDRRKRSASGQKVELGVDAAFVCTLDEQHAEIITSLAPLNLHILCEKPLATTLDDCLKIYSSVLRNGPDTEQKAIFGIGHVLRYSPHNMLLRELILQDRVIGDILSMEHTEPVGWWHFSHSYVRGNWRKESTTAPSLLTKSCHDIDLLLWLLCSPPLPDGTQKPHLPAKISSMGHLNYFRKSRKPKSAENATNCLSCPIESSCNYSAKRIYADFHLKKGNAGWPVNIVNPEIEDCYNNHGYEAAEKKLLDNLSEDYDQETPRDVVNKRPWFGRCVWESSNDVCDDQIVTMRWEDDILPESGQETNRFAKTATFHMIAHTEAQCQRRGVIYGTKGEITYDSKEIRVFNFASGRTETHHPSQPGGGHGGGDAGLARQFVLAVEAVKRAKIAVSEAQAKFLGCSLEEILRSHAAVFAAEDARKNSRVVDWCSWWDEKVAAHV